MNHDSRILKCVNLKFYDCIKIQLGWSNKNIFGLEIEKMYTYVGFQIKLEKKLRKEIFNYSIQTKSFFLINSNKIL